MIHEMSFTQYTFGWRTERERAEDVVYMFTEDKEASGLSCGDEHTVLAFQLHFEPLSGPGRGVISGTDLDPLRPCLCEYTSHKLGMRRSE